MAVGSSTGWRGQVESVRLAYANTSCGGYTTRLLRGVAVVLWWPERSVPELMLTKENTIESRFSYRMPSLFFRPFIK